MIGLKIFFRQTGRLVCRIDLQPHHKAVFRDRLATGITREMQHRTNAFCCSLSHVRGGHLRKRQCILNFASIDSKHNLQSRGSQIPRFSGWVGAHGIGEVPESMPGFHPSEACSLHGSFRTCTACPDGTTRKNLKFCFTDAESRGLVGGSQERLKKLTWAVARTSPAPVTILPQTPCPARLPVPVPNARRRSRSALPSAWCCRKPKPLRARRVRNLRGRRAISPW